jgi:hypothetical protein
VLEGFTLHTMAYPDHPVVAAELAAARQARYALSVWTWLAGAAIGACVYGVVNRNILAVALVGFGWVVASIMGRRAWRSNEAHKAAAVEAAYQAGRRSVIR